MEKETRNQIQRATQHSRALLEREYTEQLAGVYDIGLDGSIMEVPGKHLDARAVVRRQKVIDSIEHRQAAGESPPETVFNYVRESAFTALNRFAALKMLEARGLVQECVSNGDESSGFKEFCGLAPAFSLLGDVAYRGYIESLFDEIGQEVGVLFDRRDPSGLLWPRRPALVELLATINAPDLDAVWAEDETIGWIYQYFNSTDERKQMRDESQAPRNSRELAVRNQFFTPRYVVQFLVDNTLGRLWLEMYGQSTVLTERCGYLVRTDDESHERKRLDPRDLRILDPACGSGHFLLYSFDLLTTIYEEAWKDASTSPPSHASGRSLRSDFPEQEDLRKAVPRLILEENLYGIDIDPRCAQIAALALWLRAQREWDNSSLATAQRPEVRRTNIVVAEPISGDSALVADFASKLEPPLVGQLFERMVRETQLAGDMGALLRLEDRLGEELASVARALAEERGRPRSLPGMQPERRSGQHNLEGVDTAFSGIAEARILEALATFSDAAGGDAVRRRLFAGDATQGVALMDMVARRFHVVLMNPPFGAGSTLAKPELEKRYPRTKNDLYAAFVERGIELLEPQGFLGALTSRTGFFLSSFRRWREEVLLQNAPPVVFADLGEGVLDSAMVEVAAYCLQKVPQKAAP